MSKRSKACEFDIKTRTRIKARDKGCIFCNLRYMLPPEPNIFTGRYQIMHFIPRSQGGLGIPENGAVGCVYHHTMMDNDRNGLRDDMLLIFETYLRARCKDWDKSKLVYDKWT